MQVYIPVNFEREHWLLAQVNLDEKEIWFLDSSHELYKDDEYFEKLLPLKVLLPHWQAHIGFHKTHEET